MTYASDQPFRFAHSVYFTLADRSSRTMNDFRAACVKYLSGHPGQIFFAVGLRALEMRRDVNDSSFDVAMEMIFDTFASYDAYRKEPRHEEFITVTAGMSTRRRVFDWYLTDPVTVPAQAPEKEAKEKTRSPK